jgi:hypothetical protein
MAGNYTHQSTCTSECVKRIFPLPSKRRGSLSNVAILAGTGAGSGFFLLAMAIGALVLVQKRRRKTAETDGLPIYQESDKILHNNATACDYDI